MPKKGKNNSERLAGGSKNNTAGAGEGEAVEREALQKWSGKSKLEKTLQAGARGPFQLRRKERQHHLGEFRERLIRALTVEQVEGNGTYPEILEAMSHPRASKLVVSRAVELTAASEYIREAREKGLSFTTVDSPSFKGELGLVVAADDAVNEAEIAVPSRKKKLKAKGLPEELIEAVGESLCNRCYELIRERAPEELANYKKQGFFDRLFGSKCPCGR